LTSSLPADIELAAKLLEAGDSHIELRRSFVDGEMVELRRGFLSSFPNQEIGRTCSYSKVTKDEHIPILVRIPPLKNSLELHGKVFHKKRNEPRLDYGHSGLGFRVW
jgi:hypothetical protein